MTDDEPLDLSAIDPARDPERWGALVAGTMARVDAALEERARRDDPLQLIIAWRRPLLAAAAALILMLVPIEYALELRERRVEQIGRLVALSHWTPDAQRPTGADFRHALGGSYP